MKLGEKIRRPPKFNDMRNSLGVLTVVKFSIFNELSKTIWDKIGYDYNIDSLWN